MGLDISCNCESTWFRAGSYTGFNEWRKYLAKLVGFNLDDMEGFGGTIAWTGKEPFYELLYHSDCSDYLNPTQCKQLLQDFINLQKNMTALWFSLFNGTPSDWWIEKFDLWYKAIQHSVKHHCRLIFC